MIYDYDVENDRGDGFPTAGVGGGRFMDGAKRVVDSSSTHIVLFYFVF